MAENDSNGGVNSSDQQRSGVMGMNEKLGLTKPTKKKAPKFKTFMGSNIPQLPDIVLQQRLRNNPNVPGGRAESPLDDKTKNKFARSFRGGNKEMLYGG